MARTLASQAHPSTSEMTLYRPREAAAQLGIAPTTLRLWSTRFAALLRPSARKEEGGGAHRRYTAADLRVLSRAKPLLADGLTYAEVQRRLREEHGADAMDD